MIAELDELKSLVEQLAGWSVLVVGDVILDEYLIGKTTRLSREAPVPVLEFQQRRLIPGGAANPAANITALGSYANQAGVVGDDPAAANLLALLDERHINHEILVTDKSRPTTVKMRVMAHMGLRFPQQVARLDTLSREPIDDDIVADIASRCAGDFNYNVILVSDYHCGLLVPTLVDTLRDFSHFGGVPMAVDAQGSFEKYRGVDLIKCNADEARAYLRRDLMSDDDFAKAALQLCQQLRLKQGMVITRGASGATLAQADGTVTHCPAPAVSDVYDTVGAGDTTIAVLTLALAANAHLPAAVELANYASGLVIRRVGNHTPTSDELIAALVQKTNK